MWVRLRSTFLSYVFVSLLLVPSFLYANNILLPGDGLMVGQLLVSPSGLFTLSMQGDGNLVIYGPKGATWSTATGPLQNTPVVPNYVLATAYGGRGNYTVLQGDGNFVLYRNGNPTWWSGTQGYNQVLLALQDDGNLVIYTRQGSPLWSVYSGRTYYLVLPSIIRNGQVINVSYVTPPERGNTCYVNGRAGITTFLGEETLTPNPFPNPPLAYRFHESLAAFTGNTVYFQLWCPPNEYLGGEISVTYAVPFVK